MRRNFAIGASCVLALLCVSNSDASTTSIVEISTADRPLIRGKRNQGFWEHNRANGETNANYATGKPSSDGIEHRGYLTFYLGSVDRPVISAKLLIARGPQDSPLQSAALGIFDVSTPPRTLNRQGGINNAVFEDIGTGNLYASGVVPRSGEANFIEFDLNSTAVKDINFADDAYFSVGMAVLDFNATQYPWLFRASGYQSNYLQLTLIPEPNSVGVGNLALLSFAAIRRRR